jgi:ribosomal protein L24
MRKLLSLSAICLLGLLPMGCNSSQPPTTQASAQSPAPTSSPEAKKPEGNEFKSEAGKFTVVSPVPLKEKVEPVVTSIGNMQTHMFAGEKPDEILFTIAYTDYPEDKVKGGDPAMILDGAAKGSMTNVKATEPTFKDITVSGYPAKEVSGNIKGNKPGQEGTIKLRIILAGNRLYQVMSLRAKDKASPEMMDQFIQSFQLTEKKTS